MTCVHPLLCFNPCPLWSWLDDTCEQSNTFSFMNKQQMPQGQSEEEEMQKGF